MKKEAMIKVLRYKAEHIKTKIRPEFFAEVADMLEREPCEDTISRQAAIDALGEKPLAWTEGEYELGLQNQWEHDTDAIKALLPVAPRPETGRWIYDDEYSNWFDVTYKCSCCKRAIIVPYDVRNEVYKNYPYCHCGAIMIEPQESEEDE